MIRITGTYSIDAGEYMQFEQQMLAMIDDTQSPMESLISMSIGTNCMNTPAISSLVLHNLPSLLSLHIGKQSCQHVDRFILYDLPSLREVVVQDYAFSLDMSVDEIGYATGQFSCECCPQLERLIFSEFTFVGYTEFVLESRLLKRQGMVLISRIGLFTGDNDWRTF